MSSGIVEAASGRMRDWRSFMSAAEAEKVEDANEAALRIPKESSLIIVSLDQIVQLA